LLAIILRGSVHYIGSVTAGVVVIGAVVSVVTAATMAVTLWVTLLSTREIVVIFRVSFATSTVSEGIGIEKVPSSAITA
jgi:hypothetical protein